MMSSKQAESYLDTFVGSFFKLCYILNSAILKCVCQEKKFLCIIFATIGQYSYFINPSLAEHDMPCLSKQCRSRSVGF